MTSRCANCGATLAGPYCAQCGQHARHTARSLWVFLRDALEELTETDGRLWRTLGALLLRPGFLTDEFVAGRRARYLPPFRLYLIASVVFFGVLAGADLLRPGPAAEPRVTARASGPTAQECRDANISIFGNHWLEDRARVACLRIAERGAAEVGREFVANVPRMMFVFLPVMAAAMVPLYWRPKRYYVEHLVFFLHTHAALFFAYTLLPLVRAGRAWSETLGPVATVAAVALPLYSAWYVWSAMRRHYRQGRLATLVKFALIGAAYMVCLVFTFAGAGLLSVISAA